MSKVRSVSIKALVSILFFVMLGLTVKGETFRALFSELDPVYFVLSFLVGFLMIAVSGAKWSVLLSGLGHPIPFLVIMRIYFIGYFYTNLLPSSVGGDVVRSFYSGNRIGSQKDAAVCVFLERFTGVLLLLFLGAFAPMVKPGLYLHSVVLIPSLGALFLLGIMLQSLWKGSTTGGVKKLGLWVYGLVQQTPLPGFLKRPLCKLLRGCLDGYESFSDRLSTANALIMKRPSTLIWVVLTTVIFYGLTWVNVFFAAKTFNIDVTFMEVVAVVPTVMLILMIPISLGNLGLAEGAYVVYFGLLGVVPAAALLMGLFLRFKLIVFGCIGLMAYMTYPSRKKLKELRAANESNA